MDGWQAPPLSGGFSKWGWGGLRPSQELAGVRQGLRPGGVRRLAAQDPALPLEGTIGR